QGVLLANVLDRGLGADRGCAGKNQLRARGIQPPHERNHGIVFGQRLIRGSGLVGFWLSRLRTNINDLDASDPRTGSDLPENEFRGAWNLEEREIFRWRANKNQIVVFGVIQGKQASPLDAKLLAEFNKDAVQSMHRQDLANSGVVIKNVRVSIARGIVVTHP